jgi:glutamate-ammonia-ligase adenylyltransferase
MAEARELVDSVLEAEPDIGKIAADVGEMRTLIEKEKPARGIWDLKLIPGGLIDIEFIAQYLRLIVSAKRPVPQTYGATTREAIDLLGEMLMAASDRDTVLYALRLFGELSQIIRLCVDGPFDPADAPAGLVERLCRAGDCPDIRTLQGEVKRLSKAVRSIFDRTIKAGLAAG